jgi:cytochrome c
MNFEFNKVAGAVLGTALGVMAIGIVADMIYAPPHHEEPGYVIAVAEPGAGGEEPSGPTTSDVPPIADRLQTASAETGQELADSKCTTCHTFDKGGPTKIGPNLWGVVGANVLHSPDFDYSDAMEAKGKEGMTWTFDNLDHFLNNPKGFIPGTQMAFPGLKKPDERANVIAYLRTLSDDPVPLPPPTPAPTAEAPTEPAGTAEAPPAAETPAAPAPDHAAEPPADGAPSGHSDGAMAPAAPPETPATAPAESGASSGESGGAAPAPTEAEPPAEAESPEGAPTPDAPPATEAPAQ